MISGTVNEMLEATLSLLVSGEEGKSQTVDLIIDTGFSGAITLPLSVIRELGLVWLCREQGKLADGNLHPFDVYTAMVVLDDSEYAVEVEAADIEPLLGMSLLFGRRLMIDVHSGGSVKFEQSK